MADLPRSPDTDEDMYAAPDREPTTGMPRWVKAFGIIALVVVLLFVIVMFTGGHDPSRFRNLSTWMRHLAYLITESAPPSRPAG